MTDERLKMLETEGDKLLEILTNSVPGTEEYKEVLRNIENLERIIESAKKTESEINQRKHEMQIEDDKLTDEWRKYEAEQEKEEQRYLNEQEKEEIRYDEEQKKKLGMDLIDRLINIGRVGIDILGIVLPLVFYHNWSIMEYEFEKDGMIHTTVPGKNLCQKIFPIFKRK